MCAYESEMLLYQLHLYARKRNPELTFHPDHLKHLLDEWNIENMRQLFDMPDEVKVAIVLPLLTSVSQGFCKDTEPMDNMASIAA